MVHGSNYFNGNPERRWSHFADTYQDTFLSERQTPSLPHTVVRCRSSMIH